MEEEGLTNEELWAAWRKTDAFREQQRRSRPVMSAYAREHNLRLFNTKYCGRCRDLKEYIEANFDMTPQFKDAYTVYGWCLECQLERIKKREERQKITRTAQKRRLRDAAERWGPEFLGPRAQRRLMQEDLRKQGLKHCARCGETKKLENFYRNQTSLDGRSTWCGECLKANSRRYYTRNGKRHEIPGQS